MLQKEELVGLMIFLAIYFIIAIYIIYKNKKKQEKKEDPTGLNMIDLIPIKLDHSGKLNRDIVLTRLYLRNGMGVGDNGNIYVAIKRGNLIYKDKKLINKTTGAPVKRHESAFELLGYYDGITIDDMVKLDLLEIVMDNNKVKPPTILHTNLYCYIEKKDEDNDSEKEVKDKTETLKPKKRNSKYNKDNMLYIAYDFNILGNKSFAEVNRIIEKRKIDKLTKDKFPAVKTTSVLFFNYSYTVSDFEDVILVRKNGRSISIKNLYDNPEYYIPKKYQKGFSLDNYIHQEDFGNDVSGLIYAIYAGIVRFKKEKEI